MDRTDFASIGETGGITGSSIGTFSRTCWNRTMAAAAEELDVDGIAVRLSNPDKVYFPKLGAKGTKRRLAEYYLAVARGPMLSPLRSSDPASRASSSRLRSRVNGVRKSWAMLSVIVLA